jgi:hypothetical protein
MELIRTALAIPRRPAGIAEAGLEKYGRITRHPMKDDRIEIIRARGREANRPGARICEVS